MYITDDLIDRVTASMGDLVDNVIKVDFDDIESYDFPQDVPFGLMTERHNELYCLIIRFSSKHKNFMCMGPGAHPRNKKTKDGKDINPPFFVRWKWYNYFDDSVIAYADPVMFHDDDITLTWFAGNKDYWPLEDVAEIIEKLAINQEVMNDNIMFFGSSGGGFSSVMLGALVKNSKVLVNNPQMFVLNYYKTHVDALMNLLCKEFEGISREEIISKIKYRLDSIELFKREDYAPPITTYINIKSCNDVESQIFPFIKQYYDFENPVYLDVIYYHDPAVAKAHDPLPTPETLDIIREFAANYLNNSEETIKGNEDRVLDKRNSIEVLTDELTDLRYQNKQLNRHKVRFKKQISELSDKNRKLNRKVDSLRNSNNRLKNEIETRKRIQKSQAFEVNKYKKNLDEIKSAKTYRLWQKFAKLKRKIK